MKMFDCYPSNFLYFISREEMFNIQTETEKFTWSKLEVENKLMAIGQIKDKKVAWIRSDLSTEESNVITRWIWTFIAKHLSSLLRELLFRVNLEKSKSLLQQIGEKLDKTDTPLITLYNTAAASFNAIAPHHAISMIAIEAIQGVQDLPEDGHVPQTQAPKDIDAPETIATEKKTPEITPPDPIVEQVLVNAEPIADQKIESEEPLQLPANPDAAAKDETLEPPVLEQPAPLTPEELSQSISLKDLTLDQLNDCVTGMSVDYMDAFLVALQKKYPLHTLEGTLNENFQEESWIFLLKKQWDMGSASIDVFYEFLSIMTCYPAEEYKNLKREMINLLSSDMHKFSVLCKRFVQDQDAILLLMNESTHLNWKKQAEMLNVLFKVGERNDTVYQTIVKELKHSESKVYNLSRVQICLFQTLQILQDAEDEKQKRIKEVLRIFPQSRNSPDGKHWEGEPFAEALGYVCNMTEIPLILSVFIGSRGYLYVDMGHSFMRGILQRDDQDIIHAAFMSFWPVEKKMCTNLVSCFGQLLPHINSTMKLKEMLDTLPEELPADKREFYFECICKGAPYRDEGELKWFKVPLESADIQTVLSTQTGKNKKTIGKLKLI